MDDIQNIREAIRSNHLQKAMAIIDSELQKNPNSAMLYYLRGQIHMKRSEWSKAMTDFLQAEDIDPKSPARQCREMLCDIMNFYNKDMYNQ